MAKSQFKVSFLKFLEEEMVAGDSGGDAQKIASGVTSGDVTRVGAGGSTNPRKKKKTSDD